MFSICRLRLASVFESIDLATIFQSICVSTEPPSFGENTLSVADWLLRLDMELAALDISKYDNVRPKQREKSERNMKVTSGSSAIDHDVIRRKIHRRALSTWTLSPWTWPCHFVYLVFVFKERWFLIGGLGSGPPGSKCCDYGGFCRIVRVFERQCPTLTVNY